MKKVGLNQTSYVWGQIADSWKTYFTSPSRPSSQEVKQYSKWLNEISKGKIHLKGLVLGATPELRDALYSSNFDVYSMDINLEMILAMTQLLKNKNKDEIVIRSNWLENPLKDKYFDVILGDAVIPNIPWDKRNAFYLEVKRLLKPRGYFINRAFYVPEKKSFQDLGDLLRHFENKKSSYTTATELVFELLILTYKTKDHLGSLEKVKQILEPIRKKNIKNKKELKKTLDIIWEYWLKSVVGKVWLFPTQKEEEREYEKYFKGFNKFEAKDHPYGHLTPMYHLKS